MSNSLKHKRVKIKVYYNVVRTISVKSNGDLISRDGYSIIYWVPYEVWLVRQLSNEQLNATT